MLRMCNALYSTENGAKLAEKSILYKQVPRLGKKWQWKKFDLRLLTPNFINGLRDLEKCFKVIYIRT